MRYYDLIISDENGNIVEEWSAKTLNNPNPNALNIIFDMIIAPFGTPVGLPTIIIEGVALQKLFQAQEYTGLYITLSAGMQAGLPLANPNQAGVIMTGQIYQAFGNWEGTEMTLDLVISPSYYGFSNPGNFILNWKKGVELKDALQQTLSTVYPNVPIVFSLNSNLVLDHDEIGHYWTLDQLGQVISGITSNWLNNPVNIALIRGKLFIYDSSYKPKPVQIQFTDLIGQPVWINPQIMQMKVVMRADLQLGDIIKMPIGMQSKPGFAIATPQSFPSSEKYQTAFQGDFLINELRQVGDFRSPSGSSWVTILNCSVYG